MKSIKTKPLGEIIKHMREASNLSQKALANKIGKSESTISLYESDNQNISIDTLKKIAKVCDYEIILHNHDSDDTFKIDLKKNKKDNQ